MDGSGTAGTGAGARGFNPVCLYCAAFSNTTAPLTVVTSSYAPASTIASWILRCATSRAISSFAQSGAMCLDAERGSESSAPRTTSRTASITGASPRQHDDSRRDGRGSQPERLRYECAVLGRSLGCCHGCGCAVITSPASTRNQNSLRSFAAKESVLIRNPCQILPTPSTLCFLRTLQFIRVHPVIRG